MQPRERLRFSPITKRPPLRFPDGIRLVVWPVLALEEWDISRPMARMVITPPQGQPQLPDHPNWSWHEYGMRVGFWRLKRVFERLGATPTVTLNAPRLRDLSAGGPRPASTPAGSSTPTATTRSRCTSSRTSAASIKKTMDIIEKFWGKRPRGWFGPGLTQTFDTLDYLSRGRHRIYRRLGARRRAGDAEDHAQAGGRAALQFRAARHRHDGAAAPPVRGDVPPRDGSLRLPVRGIGGARQDHVDRLHPYLSGVPHRIGHVERTFEEILAKPGVVAWDGEQDPRLVSRHPQP